MKHYILLDVFPEHLLLRGVHSIEYTVWVQSGCPESKDHDFQWCKKCRRLPGGPLAWWEVPDINEEVTRIRSKKQRSAIRYRCILVVYGFGRQR